MDWVEETHAIGACHDAVTATDTPSAINKHHTVFSLVGCPYRADLDTCRFLALVTEFGNEESLGNLFSGNLVFANFCISITIPASER